MRRLLWTVLVAAVLPLVLAGAGDAAMWLRISTDPASPLVGRPTRVMVLTLANFSSYCADDPRADVRPWSAWNLESPDSLRFELKAFLGDRVLDIPITRRTADPAYWDGEVVFPSAGDWTLRMVYPLWSGGAPDGERCAGARTSVTVRPADRLAATSTGEIPSLALIGSLLVLGTLAGLVMLLSASVRPRR